jgi:WD40 repeat protein/SpoVK/Ycf46/Vps4 family AAA+-type ATPase
MNNEDWGEAPQISFFYGRQNKLDLLKKCIIDENCKLIMLHGIGGIGKSYLSTKLAHEISNKFDHVIWRSLRNAPSFFDISESIISFLSSDSEYNSPKNIESQIKTLFSLMKSKRCLIVIDNLESILEKSDDNYLTYKVGFSYYEDFFQKFGSDTNHNSCILLNGRELPKSIYRMCGNTAPARIFELEGLEKEACEKVILHNAELFGNETDWNNLIKFYDGNPLSLQIVARHIRIVYSGSISEFLEGNELIPNDIYELLDWHFNRLTEKEEELLFWLAINREPISISELKNDILTIKHKERIASTIESFQTKLPIERININFSLQPVLIEYTTNLIINKVINEIENCDINILDSHSLCKAQSKDYIREIQFHFIIDHIIKKLENNYDKNNIINLLFSVLKKSNKYIGYLCGNIINILYRIDNNIKGYNFSGLTIRQAFLANAILTESNFSYCKFYNTVFRATLGSILEVSISKDGKTIASGDNKGDIHLWNINDGSKIMTFKGHNGWVRSIEFSPDNSLLASCGSDYTVRIWLISTGECQRVFRGHSEQVYSVSFKDDNVIASAGEDRKVLFWDIKKGRCIKPIIKKVFKERIRSIAFSPKGDFLAISEQKIWLWNISEKILFTPISPTVKHIRKIVFSPNGKVLACLGVDKTEITKITLWDLESQKCTQEFIPKQRVWCIDFSRDGNVLAMAGDDNLIQLFNIEKNQILGILQGHTAPIKSISFSKYEDVIVSGGDDQSIKIWDYSKKETIRSINGYGNAMRSIAFSTNGKNLISGSEDSIIRLWNIETENNVLIKEFKGHSGTIQSVAFGLNDDILVSGGNDAKVRLWNINTGEYFILYEHAHWIWSVAFSYNNSFIASGSRDHNIILFNRHEHTTTILKGHTDEVHSVAFSPNDKILVSGSDDHTIRLWDTISCKQIAFLGKHDDCVRSVAFSPDGDFVVSGSDDKTIKLWDINSKTLIATFEGHSDRVRRVIFNQSGDLLYSSSDDKTIKEWSICNCKCLFTFQGHENAIWSLTYNHLKKLIASGSEDESIRLWYLKKYDYNIILRPFRPYEKMNIYKSSGITDAQKNSLLHLGAVQEYIDSNDFIVKDAHNKMENNLEEDKMKKYQVTLSFAGEDRKYAESLATILTSKGISIFYDEYNQAELWGKDLFQHFQKIYRDESEFCVIFISKYYADKLWTKHELKQAQARAFQESEEYILPLILDDTAIPGINKTTAHLDLRKIDISKVAELLLQKLSTK